MRALPEVREDRWRPYWQKLKIQNVKTITVFFYSDFPEIIGTHSVCMWSVAVRPCWRDPWFCVLDWGMHNTSWFYTSIKELKLVCMSLQPLSELTYIRKNLYLIIVYNFNILSLILKETWFSKMTFSKPRIELFSTIFVLSVKKLFKIKYLFNKPFKY